VERRINMGWFKSFITWITPPPKEVDEVAKKKVIKAAVKEATVELDKFEGLVVENVKRARTKKGTYKGDDKSTPNVNEAWVGGKAPKKKSKK
tara:strand:+ start:1191 stop:1466 length:276 start_codon:yes stop_codon:yes gene_type:complete